MCLVLCESQVSLLVRQVLLLANVGPVQPVRARASSSTVYCLVMDRGTDVAPRSRAAFGQTVAFQKARLSLVDTSSGRTIMMIESSDLSVAPAPLRTLDFISSRMAPYAATFDDQKDGMYAVIGRGQNSQQGRIDAESRDRGRKGVEPLEKVEGSIFVHAKRREPGKVEPPQLRWPSGAADVSRSFRVAHSQAVAVNWPVQAGI